MAWKAAASLTSLNCAVPYYGGGIPGLADLKPNCPVMFHWGESDQSIPLDEAKAFYRKTLRLSPGHEGARKALEGF